MRMLEQSATAQSHSAQTAVDPFARVRGNPMGSDDNFVLNANPLPLDAASISVRSFFLFLANAGTRHSLHVYVLLFAGE